ncbi:hypothetical protein CerSpe_110000 [Prunus speciosa]
MGNDYTRLRVAVWNANCPGKIKHCVWRAISDILPTRSYLSKRGVKVDPQCLACGTSVEIIFHVLCACPFAKAVWFGSKFGFRFSHHASSFKDWLCDVLVGISKAEFCLVMILWAIWKERNSHLWEGSRASPDQVAILAASWLSDYTMANSVPHIQRSIRPPKWQPPPDGWFKINVDGALNCALGLGGVGVVIRDSRGNFVSACIKRFTSVFQADHIELLAVCEGLRLGSSLGLSWLALECDSLNTVQAILSRNPDSSFLCHLFEDARTLLSQLPEATLSHVSRLCNGAAHRLARFSLSVNDFVFWLEDPPVLIQYVLSKDCNLL